MFAKEVTAMAANYAVGDLHGAARLEFPGPDLEAVRNLGQGAREVGERLVDQAHCRYRHERAVWDGVRPDPRVQWRYSARGRVVLAIAAAALLVGAAIVGLYQGLAMGTAANAVTAETVITPGQSFGVQAVAQREILVRPSDTLWQIAGRYYPGRDSREVLVALRAANDIRPGQEIVAGQRLVLPQLE